MFLLYSLTSPHRKFDVSVIGVGITSVKQACQNLSLAAPLVFLPRATTAYWYQYVAICYDILPFGNSCYSLIPKNVNYNCTIIYHVVCITTFLIAIEPALVYRLRASA